jgi:hypothetical protein
MLRLILTEDEWRSVRVKAAEEDTSMQALVADIVKSNLTQDIRTKAAAKAVKAKSKRKGAS